MVEHSNKRPPRTLGISFAILTSICLFSCFPLTQAFVLLYSQSRATVEFGTTDETGVTANMFGSDIFNTNTAALWVQVAVALAFLVIAVYAWRGKPRLIHGVFLGAVIVLSAGNFILLYSALTTPPPAFGSGLDSGAELAQQLRVSQLCITTAIPLYVVWYMSRGPARSFFRGYYLKAPSEAASDLKKER